MKRIVLWVLGFLLTGAAWGTTKGFAIYLAQDDSISSYQLKPGDLKTVRLLSRPYIASEDIVAYYRGSHEIQLTAEAFQQIVQTMKIHNVFVACVDGEPVYAGDLVSLISSASFTSVVIDEPSEWDQPNPAWFKDYESWRPCYDRYRRYQNKAIRIGLGYPDERYFKGTDPRDDPRVMEALRSAGKLRMGPMNLSRAVYDLEKIRVWTKFWIEGPEVWDILAIFVVGGSLFLGLYLRARSRRRP